MEPGRSGTLLMILIRNNASQEVTGTFPKEANSRNFPYNTLLISYKVLDGILYKMRSKKKTFLRFFWYKRELCTTKITTATDRPGGHRYVP